MNPLPSTGSDASARSLAPTVRRPGGRWARRATIALFLAAATIASPKLCSAGWDDFEFGQKLIEKGYIEYARKVYERMLADDKRSAADKDRARYGMALLGKADVIATARNPKAPWKELSSKMGDALSSIEEFVKKAGDDPKADEARFDLGSFRQWFVKWASDLANDKQALTDRATTAEDVLSEARKQMEAAIQTYDYLRKSAKKDSDKQIAEYQYVITSYFKGLVYPKCSADARNAFAEAKKLLEDYAVTNDGYLTSVFAQDFLGLTYQEIGDCQQGQDQWKAYGSAMEWFVACANTEDASDDHRKIMALGYLHIGQLANHAAGETLPITDSSARALLKDAKKYLSQMTVRAQRTTKMETGILALIEWALVEWKLENGSEAIQILKKASDYAQAGGFDGARNRANGVLGQVVAGGGASGGTADPSVVSKVADDLYGRGKYPESIAAYQRVIASAPRTPEGLKSFIYPAWARIAQAYGMLKLPVEAATANDAIVDEVRSGRIVGVGEGDKTTRLAKDALDRERALLQELANKTGDPAVRARFNKFTEEMIELVKRLGSDDRGADLAYRRARDLFDDGNRQKGDGAVDAAKRAFADSRPFFAETSKNLKSEFQDAAWVYLCRASYEIGEWDTVVKTADDALAYWNGAESKKRAETEQKIGDARRSNQAAVTYWKAAALNESKRSDKALELLDTFSTAFGKAAGDYYGRALGLRVEILAAAGKILEAEKGLDQLVKEVPDYYRMGAILITVGSYYQAKADEIQKKIDEVNKELLGTPEDRTTGVKSRLFQAQRREESLIAVLSDINQIIRRDEQFLELADASKAEEKKRVAEELKKKREQKVETDAALKKVREEIAALTKRRDELTDARAALQKEQVPPIRRTAEINKKLDDVLKDLDKSAPAGSKPRRRSENVAALAYRYYFLARLQADDSADWTVARDLYEDYLAFPDVKSAPESAPGKKVAQRFLGEIYYHTAAAAKDAAAAQTAYANAVKYLQTQIARNPVNLPLMVAHMAGDIAILPYRDPTSDRTWRIPVRKVTEVQAFKDYVRDLGGDRLPRYLNDRTQADYEKAVKAFQKAVDGMSEELLKRTVASLKSAGFDPAFYAEHGLTDSDFLLSLARAYVRSGVEENGMRGLSAARAILEGPSRPDDDSAEWWEAMTLKLEDLIAMAERGAGSSGAASPEAQLRAREAETFLSSQKLIHPRIGGVDRGPETLKEWKDLQLRLNAVMTKLGITAKAVDLEAMPKETPPPTEGATPGAPEAPAMGDAPMSDPAPAGMDAGSK